MRIGIYVQTALGSQLTGIGRHVVKLVEGLARVDDQNEYYLYYPRSRRSGDGPAYRTANARFNDRPVWFPEKWQFLHPSLWWDWWLPAALRRDGINVFHGPNHYLPRLHKCRGIVTFHDIAYFKMDVHGAGRDAALRKWTRAAIDRAAAVIALSENTRKDLLELGVPEGRIHVIYGGGNVVPEVAIEYSRRDEMTRRLGLPSEYILYVGAFQPRKNVPFLLRAFAEWKRTTGGPHKLVLAGPGENAAEEITAVIRELKLEGQVIITGFVADWELPLLYKGAGLFVLPSRYEGFTLVTIEAMAYGVPVVSTQCSSIQEGTADAAVLVPVDDVPALTQAIASVLADQNVRDTMIRKGYERASLFTWEECAGRTLDLYRSIYKQS